MNLAQIQECLLRHFTPEEVKNKKLTKQVRWAMAALDFEFFCRYYLPHHFTDEPADFHRALFTDVEEMMADKQGKNYLGVVFRGGAKTTIFNLALPLWAICLKKEHFIVITSESARMANEKASAIKDELENNDQIIADFGDLRGERWAETEFETATRIRVVALGSGMNIRGTKHNQYRPGLIILDDIESREEVSSPTQRRKLEQWWKADVQQAGHPSTKMVVIGTYLAYDCVLKEMEKSPVFWRRRNFPALAQRGEGFAFATNKELWDKWRDIISNLSNPTREADARAFYEENEEAMLEGVECAWPERFPYYQLMLYRLGGRTEFNTEFLNQPSDPDSRFFSVYHTYKRMAIWNDEIGPWLVPWIKGKNEPSGIPPVKLADCALFAATDPSMGQSTQSDYSAIIILAFDPATGYRYVLEADLQRRPPSRIIDDQTRWYERYPAIQSWTIETVQMQAFFKDQSGVESVKHGRGLPLVEYKTGQTNKHVRIQSLQAPLENGYIMLCEDGQDLLKEQIEHYPHTTHDDGPDGLEMCYNISLDYKIDYTVPAAEGERYQFGADQYMPTPEDPYAIYDAMAEEKLRERRVREAAERGEDSSEAFMIVI